MRSGFEAAARRLPVDMMYFDNAGDLGRAVANADAAIAARVDLLIEYNADAEANAEIARRLSAARIPVIALVEPLPGAHALCASTIWKRDVSRAAPSAASRRRRGRIQRSLAC